MSDTTHTDMSKPETTEWIETEDENAFRSQVFKIDDRQEILVAVPEWQRQVLIKRLTGTARAGYFTFQVNLEQQSKGTPDYWKQLWFELARLGCVHPKTKKPIFKYADRGTWMDEHDGGIIEMLGRTVQMFSQLDGSLAEQAKKNLAPILSTTDTTKLQSSSDTNR